MQKRIWLITGISSGMGKALALAVMETGDFVIGTFRKQDRVEEFNQTYGHCGLAALLDLTDFKGIEAIISMVNEKFGRIDVLVNNAGFGMAGAIEETSMQEVRDLFDANFFGVLKLTQQVLPIMRLQRRGHIIQISSHGGFNAFAGFGIYNASKFALEGFSEALAQEVLPLGIKVTIVEPGPFRTGFAGSSLKLANKVIEDYSSTSGLFREKIKSVDGKQEGDPAKAAQAILKIVAVDEPPLRLPLGKTALSSIRSKIESVTHDMHNWAHLAEQSVFKEK